jgi:transposase
MDGIALSLRQRRQLERQLAETTDARVYRRTLAVLEVARGVPLAEVARTLSVTRQSIYNWIETFLSAGDAQSLQDDPRAGRPTVWNEQRVWWLRALLETSPAEWGYFAGSWTVPLLREHVAEYLGEHVSADTVRRELSRLGYVWKRCRYVLQPDPEKEKKTPHSLENQALATPQRAAGRRRNRFAVVSSLARRLGLARRGRACAAQRTQRPTSDFRSTEPAHGTSAATLASSPAVR